MKSSPTFKFPFKSLVVLFFGLSLLGSNHICAQENFQQKRTSYFVLPLAFYLPETNLGFGAAGNYSFLWPNQNIGDRPSSLTLGFAYTLNKQILFYIPYNIFFKEEEYWIKGELGYYDFIYQYFGVGNENRIEEEKYAAKFPRIELDALKRVKPNLYIGINYRFDDMNLSDFKPSGNLESGTTLGVDGGITSGVGPMLIYDSRDHINWPTKGILLESRFFYNTSILGADYEASYFEFYISKYFAHKKNVLALNFISRNSFGEVPFYELAFYGGGKRSRGYLKGGFRDKNVYILQAEYRVPIWKRLGGVIFANGGGVYQNTEDINLNNFLPAAGIGLRYEIDKNQKINIRFDVGFGKNSVEFYFTFKEAF